MATLSFSVTTFGVASSRSASALGRPFASPRLAVASAAAGRLKWRSCADLGAVSDRTRCATLSVPVDAAARSDTVGLAVVRIAATGPGPRLGSLFINPGGPGVPARAFAVAFSRLAKYRNLLSRYDIVGVDPRGTGGSRELDCVPQSVVAAYLLADVTPDNAAERDVLIRTSAMLGEDCRAASDARWLASLGTRTAVSDLEAVRVALGDPQFNLLGFSYGTFLGLRYAQTYPRTVGKMVLDGVLDPDLTLSERADGQAIGLDAALAKYFQRCDRVGCPLRNWGSASRSAADSLGYLLDSLERQPIRLGSRQFGEAEIRVALLGAMYLGSSAWSSLDNDFAALKDSSVGHGDPTAFLRRFDAVVARDADGKYGSVTVANYAVNCLDVATPTSAEAVNQDVVSLVQRAPVFGALVGWSTLPCVGWPGAKSDSQAAGDTGDTGPTLGTLDTSPLLLIGTTGDPVTPLRWTQQVAERIGTRHRLLRVEGDTHTSLLRNSCAQLVVERYLVDDDLPDRKARC